MRRKSYANNLYGLVFGVGALGAFLELYHTKNFNGGSPFFVADHRGVVLFFEEDTPRSFRKRIDAYRHRCFMAKEAGIATPRLTSADINAFARLCGFDNLLHEILLTVDAN